MKKTQLNQGTDKLRDRYESEKKELIKTFKKVLESKYSTVFPDKGEIEYLIYIDGQLAFSIINRGRSSIGFRVYPSGAEFAFDKKLDASFEDAKGLRQIAKEKYEKQSRAKKAIKADDVWTIEHTIKHMLGTLKHYLK